MISTRAEVLTARTYNRPIMKAGKMTGLETWEQTALRVVDHSQWLWERAKGDKLTQREHNELKALLKLILERKVLPAGRTLWMGGTEVARKREASQFNCSHLNLESVHDFVDLMWLLMQGCGVGFTAEVGTLNGFAKPIEDVQVLRSTRTEKSNVDDNEETWDPDKKVWTLKLGDSAEAWAKFIGKLLAGKYPADRLVFDFTNIRPAGGRLSRYGWISSGDTVVAKALPRMAEILSRRAGSLLTKIDILDLANWCGVIQTGRRGAEIGLIRYGDPEWRDYALAKKDYFEKGNEHRTSSNNTLVFYEKPNLGALTELFEMMQEAGGSEPGLYNASAALARAPWFKGTNPCGEILLGNKSFCNLVETDLAKFKENPAGLHRAHWLVARANYRQTCVDLDDGILQRAWHENNEFLRLCGAGLTGIARRPDLGPYDYKVLRNIAVQGAYSMADHLGLPRPKNVTTIKPSGTVSKIADTTEGVHKPLGRYIFNTINFSSHDPIIGDLEEAGYKIFPNPDQPDAVLACFPVEFNDVPFDIVDGKHVNMESATTQLERYRMLMDNYVDQNCSITVSYSPREICEIVHWVNKHWDSYVGVSFLPRVDPTKTAKDLGYNYLPQEVKTAEEWHAYADTLKPVDVRARYTQEEIMDEECATGACPIR